MAKVLIAGGGFGGIVAAEALAKSLGREHHITLISRTNNFLFYPALVRLAFNRCEPDDVSFDLRDAMLDRRVSFVKGEIARVNIEDRYITLAHGDVAGDMPFDYLVLALGRRLATEQVTGFFEYAHRLLGIQDALKFRLAVQDFHEGHAVIGCCPGARLPIPVFETAFALANLLDEKGERDRCRITIVSNETTDEMFGGAAISETLNKELKRRGIEIVSDFAINRVNPTAVVANDGRTIECDLTMLVPPFVGPAAVIGRGITDDGGYVKVDKTMRVTGVDRIYAAGDSVALPGPKLGHMAVKQGDVGAKNLISEIAGEEPTATYEHEMLSVIEAEGANAILLHKDFETDDPANVRQGRFWSWAKFAQQKYWKVRHT